MIIYNITLIRYHVDNNNYRLVSGIVIFCALTNENAIVRDFHNNDNSNDCG